MNAGEIILKTKRRIPLSKKELMWFIDGYVKGDIPDYQVSAWLMAVCLNSLTIRETIDLTMIMRDSGETADLSGIDGITVDKHSTGGIGDKTSLIIAPVCAACGLKVPKMSGRGLGFTGGTIDKLESIPGFNTALDADAYIENINRVGTAVISQSGNLAPADKKLYALRDVTATVDSIPLICSSIMSKKLATGADCILLDVKTGSGAFMKNEDDAKKLGELMVATAKSAGKKCKAVITDMNEPLGRAVGNALEVIEVLEILKGHIKGRLLDLCINLSANMLFIAGMGTKDECTQKVKDALESNKALEKFCEMVKAQGADDSFVHDYSLLPKADLKVEILSPKTGYVSEIDSETIGFSALFTGAGRAKMDDRIDYSAGIIMNCQIGSFVKKGEPLMTLYSCQKEKLLEAKKKAEAAVTLSDLPPKPRPLIISEI